MASYNSLKFLLKYKWRSSFFSKRSGYWLCPLAEQDPETVSHVTWITFKQ